MLPFILLGSLYAASAVTSARTNDWSLPCFNGECAYDIPESAGSGSIKVSGSLGVIKDISPAAGWVILSCDPQSLKQEIRLVCEHEAEADSPCNHLFMHDGPVGALVRLPESCGSGPFARIASATIASDQSLPTHVTRQFSRRQLIPPQIHVLSIDTDFDKIDTAKWGNIHFTAAATSSPSAPNQHDSGIQLRTIPKNAHTLSPFTVAPGSFDLNATASEVVVSKSRVIVSESKACGTKTAGLRVKAENKIKGIIATGFEAKGTLAPPAITNFSTFVSFSGNISARFDVTASLLGPTTKDVDLWQEWIHPVSIPGVLDLEPSFDATAWVEAQIGLPTDADFLLNFETRDATVWYPPRSESAPITANLTHNHVDLRLLSGTRGRTDIIGHIIPKIHLHVTAFGGKYKTSTHLNLDLFSQLAVEAENDTSLHGYTAIRGGIAINGTSTGNIYGLPVDKTFFDNDWEVNKTTFPAQSHATLPEDPYRDIAINQPKLHCPDVSEGKFLTITS